MTVLSENFSSLYTEGLASATFDAYLERPESYASIFDIRSSKKKTETVIGIEGLTRFSEKSRGDSVSLEDPIANSSLSFTHKTYAKGVEITFEDQDDELYNLFTSFAAQLGRAAREGKEIDHYNILNRAFDTSNYADGHDSKALITTDHPYAGGSTYQNEPTNATELDYDALNDLLELIDDAQDGVGKKILLKPMYLVVPTELRREAVEIVKSMKVPDDSSNAVNAIVDQYDLKVVISPWLTDADAWFVTTEGCKDGLISFDRMALKSYVDSEPRKLQNLYMAAMRYSMGWYDPHSIYGSPGA